MIYDGLIVGAGPVGLMVANYLGRAGWRILVVDKLERPVETSRAIGVTPPSLEIFQDLGLDQELIASGVKIQNVKVYGNGKILGEVDFSGLPREYPFILSVPQIKTEKVLALGLKNYPQVEIRRGTSWIQLESSAEARVLISRLQTSTEDLQVESRYLFACDGGRSGVRESLGLSFPGHDYPYTFLMGDFPDNTPWGPEARLFFTPQGAVESFPLPAGMRRWIVQTSEFINQPEDQDVSLRVFQRTGMTLSVPDDLWQSPFSVRRRCMKHFYKGQVYFLGDAAHLMSPIGGQGMNTGFASVRDLMGLMMKNLDKQRPLEENQLSQWNRARQKAFKCAADRAWQGMFLGVQTGGVRSTLRNFILRIMLTGPWKKQVPLDYAMLSIPQDPRFSH